MLEVQKSYQALLRVLRGECEFVPIVISYFDKVALSKQIECIVTAIGEHAAKNKESAPSAVHNIDYTAALEDELHRLYEQEFIDIEEEYFDEVATRLNSVVKAQQNFA